MVLQLIHGHIKSIILHSANNKHKLQGFEHMDKVALQLEGLVGKSKVKTAKIFHR